MSSEWRGDCHTHNTLRRREILFVPCENLAIMSCSCEKRYQALLSCTVSGGKSRGTASDKKPVGDLEKASFASGIIQHTFLSVLFPAAMEDSIYSLSSLEILGWVAGEL